MEKQDIAVVFVAILIICLIILFESSLRSPATASSSVQPAVTVRPNAVISDSQYLSYDTSLNYFSPATRIGNLALFSASLATFTDNASGIGFVNNSAISFIYSNSTANQSLSLGTYLFTNYSAADLAYNGFILQGGYENFSFGNINITGSFGGLGSSEYAVKRTDSNGVTVYTLIVLENRSVITQLFVDGQDSTTIDPDAISVMSEAAPLGYNYTVGPDYTKRISSPS